MDTQLQLAELKTGNKCEHKPFFFLLFFPHRQIKTREFHQFNPSALGREAYMITDISKNRFVWTVDFSFIIFRYYSSAEYILSFFGGGT